MANDALCHTLVIRTFQLSKYPLIPLCLYYIAVFFFLPIEFLTDQQLFYLDSWLPWLTVQLSYGCVVDAIECSFFRCSLHYPFQMSSSVYPWKYESEKCSLVSALCFCWFYCLNNLLRAATHLCFSKHIGLFFPDPNLPLGVHELERHPVIARLKEAFREGEQSGDTRFYCVPLCSTVTRS